MKTAPCGWRLDNRQLMPIMEWTTRSPRPKSRSGSQREFAKQHLECDDHTKQALRDLLAALPLEERLAGLTPEERLRGLSPEGLERLRQLLQPRPQTGESSRPE